MDFIPHQLEDTETGITFLVHCPVQLSKEQVIRAVRLHWNAMKVTARTKAERAGRLEFVIHGRAADLL